MQSKYRNQKTVIDGILFDSKKEANRYSELMLLQRSGKINSLKMQVRFEIIPKQKGERAACYIADFVYHLPNGAQIVEDTKSEITRKNPTYVLKRKLFKVKYPHCEFRES